MNLEFLTYFQLIFYVILGLAILMGFLRGMKKTLFTLITMAIFYVVFFLTVVPASKFLWNLQMPWLGGILGNIDSSLSNFTSFKDSLTSILQLALGSNYDVANASQELLDLATGIGQFALKIVYTVLYFTVILLLYKLICWILGMIILGKSEKGASKNRGFGALFGALNGVMAIFIMLVMLGGFMSVIESTVTLIPTGGDGTQLALEDNHSPYEASQPIVALQAPLDPGSMDMEALVTDLQGMVESYNNNPFVRLANSITAPSIINADEKVPLNINLFDRVLSFEFNGHTVAIRYELTVLSGVAEVFLNSEYATTGNISDITGNEIRQVFADLGQSPLIVSILPLGIEIGAEMMEQPLPITQEELYNIPFAEELPKLGEIAGALFDILNGAGVISGEGDYQDITITPQVVRDLFTDMSDSQIVILAIEGFLVPMLENGESGAATIIKIPADINWETELVALGNVMADIFQEDLSFADLTSGDMNALIDIASKISIDDILDSQLISETLINILSGQAGIEGLSFLVIPEGIDWLDAQHNGELRNILEAMQAILTVAADVNFGELSVDTIAKLDDQAIEKLFGSYVLTATISDMLLSQDFGDTEIVIPDDVFDDQHFIYASELTALAKAMVMIVNETGGGTEFDVTKALNLSSADIDKFLDSEIIAATVGKMIKNLNVDMLVIPEEATTDIMVDSAYLNVVDATEIKSLLLSLQVLHLDQFDSMSFTASLIENFEDPENPANLDDGLISTFLGSMIVHASVSSMILDLGSGDSSLLVIPSVSSTDTAVIDTVGTTDYIDADEIGYLFKALHVLPLGNDFNNIDLEDTSLLFNNLTLFLDSAILHATISDQILSIDPTLLVVPAMDGDLSSPAAILIQPAETPFIAKTELENFVAGIQQLGFNSPTDFTSTFTLSVMDEPSEQTTILDSAILHASISKKLIDFSDSVLIIPDVAEDNLTVIKYQTGPIGEKTDYVSKTEITSLIDALGVLGVGSVDGFSSLSLNNLFPSLVPDDYQANQDTLLASASMQATISAQMLGLNDSVLIVPDADDAGGMVYHNVGGTDYVIADEIKDLIDAIDVLLAPSGDSPIMVDSLTGSFSLDNLSTLSDQDTLLASASMHATISQRLFEVDPDVITVPALDQNGDDVILLGTVVGSNKDFVTKTELKTLIDSLLLMNFHDLDSFTTAFDLTQIFANAPQVLESATIQAMFSDRILNDTGTALVVPDLYYGTANEIRIEQGSVTYIEYAELVAFIHSLDLLSLDNISDSWSFTPGTIFAIDDFADLVASEIMQATISDNILPVVKSELEAPAITDFIVPLYFRQDITVESAGAKQIEATELARILTALKMLDFTNFDDAVNATSVTSLSESDLTTILTSASMHVTTDNMLKDNPNISVPQKAYVGNDPATVIYDIAGLIQVDEIKYFIVAAKVAGGESANFTSIDFDYTLISGLSAENQTLVLRSMIVKFMITPDLVSAVDSYNLLHPDPDLYAPVPDSMYEDSDNTSFLTAASILELIDYISTPII